jgi:hypothetical protein
MNWCNTGIEWQQKAQGSEAAGLVVSNVTIFKIRLVCTVHLKLDPNRTGPKSRSKRILQTLVLTPCDSLRGVMNKCWLFQTEML